VIIIDEVGTPWALASEKKSSFAKNLTPTEAWFSDSVVIMYRGVTGFLVGLYRYERSLVSTAGCVVAHEARIAAMSAPQADSLKKCDIFPVFMQNTL
jgi:hypothetical protein